MRSAITKSKLICILVSILIAIIFWLFVRIGRNPDVSNRVRGIPVTVSGSRVLENQGLMIDTVSQDVVTLTWEGNWNSIRQLDKESVSVTVDTSRVTEAGIYELDYSINYPNTVSPASVSLKNKEPARITVKISKIHSRTFEIRPILKGSIAAGFQANEFIMEPETVLISGTQARVDAIDSVQVILEADELSETFSGDLPITLLDKNGNQLEHTGFSFSVEQAYVVLPVVMTKEVPLTINFIAGGGATEDVIDYKITPETIVVSGPQSQVEDLESICLGSIDLAKVIDVLEQEYTIYPPAGIENVSGFPTASVRVSVEGLATREFEVSDIQIINVPDGYTATLTSQIRAVTLRGKEDALDRVQPSQIRLVADLADMATATGSYNVPVKIYLFADNDVGVIGQNVVVVNLRRG